MRVHSDKGVVLLILLAVINADYSLRYISIIQRVL